MIDPRMPDYANTPVSPKRPKYGYLPRDGSIAAPVTVSVITPFFNTGEVSRETIANLLSQSLQSIEIIIVNDGSKDTKSLEVLDEYRALGERDPRVRVIDHPTNRGVSAARNTGIAAARGEFLFFLDADDLIEPTTLEKCALCLRCNENFEYVKGLNVGFGAKEYLWDHSFHSREEFLRENLTTLTAMLRTDVVRRIGCFDEEIRKGMEDWEFWLRSADRGVWGGTIPEYLDWYRRRENQHASWEMIATPENRAEFQRMMRERFPRLYSSDFPSRTMRWHEPFADLGEMKPLPNPLAKSKPRLLMVPPWLTMGGADKFNLDLTRYLTQSAGWEVTIATTLPNHPWLSEFTALTPDVFLMDHLARPTWYPAILSYLIESRGIDVVLITNSRHGYASLPYLRSKHPGVTFIDLNHMEEQHYHNGGHPRVGAALQGLLDLNIVVSEHLKRWMVARGAEADRIEPVHINADTNHFKPDSRARARVRKELGLKDEVAILYAGRLCEQKQPLVFARSIRDLAQETTNFVALVAGTGELGPALEDALDRYGVRKHVRMLGSVKAADMPALMAASDVFFLPSLWEGISLAIYEAMSAGLAVVGADVGGQIELVTPECGVLLRRPDPEDHDAEARAYAAVLAELVKNPGTVARLGRAARTRILEHFRLERMGERFLASVEKARRLNVDQPRPAIDPALAREMTVQHVELLRVHALADEIWPYRERWLSRVEQERHEHEQRLAAARAEVQLIETSRAYRWLTGAKKSWLYKAYANGKYGPGWESNGQHDDPIARLNHIRGSRVYKLIQGVKSVPGLSPSKRIRKK